MICFRFCGGRGHSLIRRRDSQRFHFAVEMRTLEAERARGLRHVPAVFLELAQNKFALVGASGFVQSSVWLMQTFRDAAKEFGREMVRLDARLRADDDETLDKIAKFANVSG